MAKAHKPKARKSASRPPPRTAAPLVNSLPPQILEQAAQGWLKSSGAPVTTPSSTPPRKFKADSLVECLEATLQGLRAEIDDLQDRVARLEGRAP